MNCSGNIKDLGEAMCSNLIFSNQIDKIKVDAKTGQCFDEYGNSLGYPTIKISKKSADTLNEDLPDNIEIY